MISSLGHAGPTPEFVMRTGAYALMDPVNARHGVSANFIDNWTKKAVGLQPSAPGTFQTTPTAMGYFGDPLSDVEFGGLSDNWQRKAIASGTALATGAVIGGFASRTGRGALYGAAIGLSALISAYAVGELAAKWLTPAKPAV